MSTLNPEKLSVEYREGVSSTEPVIPRRYTLTHSDITAELFLTIGTEYAYDQITSMRDEVLGEWVRVRGRYRYQVYLMVDSEKGMSAVRNYIFRRELPLALEAIRYGDDQFFKAHPSLNYVPIIVYFRSESEKYNKVEYWGTFTCYEI